MSFSVRFSSTGPHDAAEQPVHETDIRPQVLIFVTSMLGHQTALSKALRRLRLCSGSQWIIDSHCSVRLSIAGLLSRISAPKPVLLERESIPNETESSSRSSASRIDSPRSHDLATSGNHRGGGDSRSPWRRRRAPPSKMDGEYPMTWVLTTPVRTRQSSSILSSRSCSLPARFRGVHHMLVSRNPTLEFVADLDWRPCRSKPFLAWRARAASLAKSFRPVRGLRVGRVIRALIAALFSRQDRSSRRSHASFSVTWFHAGPD